MIYIVLSMVSLAAAIAIYNGISSRPRPLTSMPMLTRLMAASVADTYNARWRKK